MRIANFYKFLFFLFLSHCGQSNTLYCTATKIFKVCTSQSDDEKAMIALNEGDYDEAQRLLEALIADDPLAYFRYPRLGATYAAQAQFSLTNLSQLNTGSSSGLFDKISGFLPTPDPNNLAAFQPILAKMKQARTILLAMPKVERTKGTSFYGASAELQLILYQMAYSIMYINQFTVKTSSGALDPNVLASMTIEDAQAIIQNLVDAAQISGQTNPAFSEAASKINAQIQSTSGSDDKEKVSGFLKARNAGHLQ